MKQLILKFLLVGSLAASGAAQAVMCSVTATSVPLSTLYASVAATNVAGSIGVTCTKEAGDDNKPYIYIGIDQGEPPMGRAMTRQNGSNPLTYEIYHRNYGAGIWNEADGVKANTDTPGGVFYRMGTNAGAQTENLTYYVRIPALQATASAGIYDDLAIGVTVRLSNDAGSATGTTLATTSFGVSASIQNSCYFSSSPAPLILNYTSFMAAPSVGSTAFQLSCTYNSAYTLAIGPPASGTLLGLNYSLALSASTGIGTGNPQSFSVNGTIAANQSGTCATSNCSGSQLHTVTVEF